MHLKEPMAEVVGSESKNAEWIKYYSMLLSSKHFQAYYLTISIKASPRKRVPSGSLVSLPTTTTQTLELENQ